MGSLEKSIFEGGYQANWHITFHIGSEHYETISNLLLWSLNTGNILFTSILTWNHASGWSRWGEGVAWLSNLIFLDQISITISFRLVNNLYIKFNIEPDKSHEGWKNQSLSEAAWQGQHSLHKQKRWTWAHLEQHFDLSNFCCWRIYMDESPL